jgi:lipopolysaccharide export system protein LptA
MVVLLDDKLVSVQQVDLLGRASMKQRSATTADKEEFQLLANSVRINDAEGLGQHQIVAVGRPVDIRTDRFTLRTAQVQLDRADNTMWSDGSGQMSIQMDRDLNGQPLRVPQTLGVNWTDGMRFDGQRIAFRGNVDVRGSNQRIRASRMEVDLTKRIDFSQSTSAKEIDIQQVLADGNVLIENRDVVDNRVNSMTYMQVPHIRINRVTGDTFADGPGRIVTHRYGFSSGMKLPGNAVQPERPSSDGRITFLQVDFQRQLEGNVIRRVATLKGQVQVIYGPVLSWNESINPDTALGEDDVLLSCNELTFAQGARLSTGRQSVNMEAQGNTYVEGRTFTARGQRISFEQAKDLLVLEGTARSDAVLSHQSRIGAPRSETAARKILYWTTTGRVEVDAGRYVDLSNLGL